MITLKTPIQITKHIAEGLEKIKNTLIFSSNRNWFIILKEYKIEEKEVTHKSWGLLGGKTTVDTEYFLTEATALVWNTEKKNWTFLSEAGLTLWLYYDDPQKNRKTYLDIIKAPLENLGVKFKTEVNE